MNGVQLRLLWLSCTLTALTGAVYAAMRYLMEGDDPFSAYNHPLQPWALDAHLLLAPALLFVVGWFWGNHVLPKLRARRRTARLSGLLLLALGLTMVLTGYLLQTTAEPLWRTVLAWSHGVIGTLFTVILVGHAVTGRRAAARQQPRLPLIEIP